MRYQIKKPIRKLKKKFNGLVLITNFKNKKSLTKLFSYIKPKKSEIYLLRYR
jgi:hypothetical protein